MNTDINKKNIKLALILGTFAMAMVGFGFIIAPYYDLLCCKAGIKNGKQCPIEKPIDFTEKKNREINLQFITTVSSATPMEFRAETTLMKVHPGENYTVNFYAENKTNQEIITRAIPSFSPGLTADYLRKIECFCFTEQKFKPHEAKIMPVRFVVSKDLPEEEKIITLSYTFYDITEKLVTKGEVYVYNK